MAILVLGSVTMVHGEAVRRNAETALAGLQRARIRSSAMFTRSNGPSLPPVPPL